MSFELDHISISSLSEFSRCPFKWCMSHVKRLEPIKPSQAMAYGGALHKALPWAIKGDLAKAITEFDQEWDSSLDDDKRNTKLGIKLVDCLVRKKLKLDILLPGTESLAAVQPSDRSPYELKFAVDIGLEVPFVGFIDGIVMDLETKSLWCLEFKTTGSALGSFFFNNFELNPQIIGYPFVLSLHGISVMGTKVLAVDTRTKDTKIEIIDRIVPPWQYKLFQEWALVRGQEMVNACKNDYFLKDLTGCTPYASFGMSGWQCDYVPYCANEGDETLILPLYKSSTPSEFSDAKDP